MSTAIHVGVGGTTGALGEQVYDTATVAGTPFTPTGTVTYNFYNTASPVYGVSAPVSTQTVTLSGGSVPNSRRPRLWRPAATRSLASTVATATTRVTWGRLSRLTVNQGSSSVSTAIQDAAGGAVTGALGEQVYDTAAVTGTPFTPTGTVTYYFYNTASPVYGTTARSARRR